MNIKHSEKEGTSKVHNGTRKGLYGETACSRLFDNDFNLTNLFSKHFIQITDEKMKFRD